MAALQVGDTAPDFDLVAVTGDQKHRFKLSDFKGKKNVLIAFYALDWTPTWTAQMPAYDVDLDKFADVDAQVVGISMDSPFSHIAWQKHEIGLLHFPLCSDFYPHGEVAGKYGVLRLGDPLPGISERAIFIVDKKGKIAYSKLYQLSQQPDNQEALDALRKLV